MQPDDDDLTPAERAELSARVAEKSAFRAEHPPSFTTTYRRADGQDIDDRTWVHTLDWFKDLDEPVEVVEEIWDRKHVHSRWVLPAVYGDCEIEDEEECGEKAVTWEQHDGVWTQVCENHRSTPGG